VIPSSGRLKVIVLVLVTIAVIACVCALAAHAAPSRGGNRIRESSDRVGAPSRHDDRGATVFLNRVAAAGRLEPSARGRLADLPDGPRDLELTSGAVLKGSDTRGTARPARAIPNAAGRAGYVVQFAGESPDSARARLERAGVTTTALPGGGWLVRMDAVTKSRVEGAVGHPLVRAWDPSFKLSPALERTAAAPVEVAALLFGDGDLDGTAGALAALGASGVRRHRNDLNRLIRFTIDPARLADAAGLPDILWMEPVARDSIFNDQAQWVVQTGIDGSRKMWDRDLRGAGQIVMQSDSGVRTNHEMFYDAAHDITGYGNYPAHRKIVAYWPGSDAPDIGFGDHASSNYHGTHTAGSIVGNNDPTSTQPYDGMAKDARLWVTDLAGEAANGSIHPPDDLNDLFLPSYVGNAAGAARIASNSWGSQAAGSYTLSSMQVDQFMWTHPDYLIAYAAGNEGYAASVGSPATAKNCLSVGGTQNGTDENRIYSYTSRGPTKDLRRKPTVCAPAEDVISSIGSTRYAYAAYSGTSMATPVTAGALAIARQYLVDGWYPTGAPVAANGFAPSAALLKAMAVGSAMNDVLGFAAPDNNVGWGRIDLDQVLYCPGDSSRTVLVDAAPGLTDREYVEYQVLVKDASQPLRVSMCWTDAPGNPAVKTQIVNDLDLIVANGPASYLGNRIVNGASRTGGTRDSLNVEEGVRIVAPTPGYWTIRVEGHRIPVGPQPFALCITGTIGGDGGAVALGFDYALDDTLEVEVLDTDATGPLQVTVTSATEPGGEVLALPGTGGVFRGRLRLASSPAKYGDGTLSVTAGDAITATYRDPSSASQLSAFARVNVQAPVITGVHARQLDASTALVSWNTDLSASSRVRFGTGTPLTSVADSAGLTLSHQVLLPGLRAGRTYLYDVESSSLTGSVSADSLGGAHRTFTTRAAGQFGLVMADANPFLVSTWSNALAALGWDYDLLVGPAANPPVAGDAGVGLRRYAGVLWQTDPDRYPPFSDAQRGVVDSLVNSGGRLFVTGHDIGYALADAGSPVYTPERELWVESGLKTRYYYDDLSFASLSGVAGDPVSGAWTTSVPYHALDYGMAGDIVIPAPGTDGIGTTIWYDGNGYPVANRWEGNAPAGTPGTAFWGGTPARLIGMFNEWTCIGAIGAANDLRRTGVLESSLRWLIGHRPPHVTITSPAGGELVMNDFLPVRFRIEPDTGRAITTRQLWYSLNGGDAWSPLPVVAWSDSGAIIDLGGALGGPPVANSLHVLLKLIVTDDGAPALRALDVTDAEFTLARTGGDRSGPVVIAGSVGITPTPVTRGRSAALLAAFSDAETGGSAVTAAEYSWGAAAKPAGAGTPMTLTPGAQQAQASADLATAALPGGTFAIWVRARDLAGNWGAAAGLQVIANGEVVSAVGDLPSIDFLATPSPNPFRGASTLRFGLARPGAVSLELFDVAGRRVRTLASGPLAAGAHARVWDGRDGDGHTVGAGIYFARLVTPAGTYRTRLVSLQ
jgi:hypothetical protein